MARRSSEQVEGEEHLRRYDDAFAAGGWYWPRPQYVWKSICTVLLGGRIKVLLPFGPLAIFVRITPLAERLGYATEQIAYYTGPTVGGLLNATFGNATEMMVSIFALKSGMISVIQQSLLGSILSNLLMVLGCAFFVGGIVHRENKVQVFNKAAAIMDSAVLLVGIMVITTVQLVALSTDDAESQLREPGLPLSRFSSCMMLLVYAAYLFFQLKSHHSLYNPILQNQEDVPDVPETSQWEAISWLAILTVCVSVLSEQLVDAIQGASESLHLPTSFINVILVPIAGNSAAYATTIMFAIRDKLDISLAVAIGSSTQIAMFAIPFYVVVGWIVKQPMDLNFQLFETATLFISMLITAYSLQEGRSSYMKGLVLILCYCVVGAGFFLHVDR
ncbi:unnamed protein product [Linum trigynum]|uniref:Vacuolar cation/proton exchanger n=1 Tax=Linum trigynum TaxID=586398 RepID=A0AAV2DKU8_9ROSI